MKLGEPVAAITFHITEGVPQTLSDYRGQWVVLYFYPKDATPGCTLESQEFRDQHAHFLAEKAVILGVSRDGFKSHTNFKTKECLPFDLISDQDEQLCQQFDVIKMKSMYGKSVRGIERSTFLIDPQGILRHEWRKVNVKGHVDDVLNTLISFSSNANSLD
jgi:peroxiredoxin Q/BCP